MKIKISWVSICIREEFRVFESSSREGKCKITVTVWNFMTSNTYLINPWVNLSYRKTFRNDYFPNLSVRLIMKSTHTCLCGCIGSTWHQISGPEVLVIFGHHGRFEGDHPQPDRQVWWGWPLSVRGEEGVVLILPWPGGCWRFPMHYCILTPAISYLTSYNRAICLLMWGEFRNKGDNVGRDITN
jgi:hypothetical protein